MVGVPDYDAYVDHQRKPHPGEPVMTYEELFRERRSACHSVAKGSFKGCC